MLKAFKKECTIYNMDFLTFTVVQVNQQSQQYLYSLIYVLYNMNISFIYVPLIYALSYNNK